MGIQENDQEVGFYSVEEMAKFMGISKTMAYSYVKNNECPFKVVRMGSRWLIPRNAFFKWYKGLAEDNEECQTEIKNITEEMEVV